MALKGELSDKETKATLAKFLRANIGLTTELVSGVHLASYQEILLKAWFNRNFSLNVMGRGLSKTADYRTTQVIERERGLLFLKDLIPNVDFTKAQDGNYVLEIEPIELWNGSDWQRTDKIIVQQKKSCLKVTTKRGYSLTGSINHIVRVLDKECNIVWKKYSDLEIGDVACISRNNSVNWGAAANIDESYMVGLLIGDGCYAHSAKNRMFVTSADEEILHFLDQRGAKIQSCSGQNKAKNAVFSKSQTVPFLTKWGIQRSLSYTKSIPSTIMAHKDNLKACLQGLFDTDGSVATDCLVVDFSTVSEVLANQVHDSLLTFGIVSSLKDRKTPSSFGKIFEVTICGDDARKFAEHINFRLTRKRAILQRHILLGLKPNTNLDIVPYAKEILNTARKQFSFSTSQWVEWKSLRVNSNVKNLSYSRLQRYVDFFHKHNLNHEKLNNFDRLLSENFFYDSIESIEPTQVDCLDFNIPTGERYWSNGFISHNSYLAGLFSALITIFEPNTNVLIAGPTFRTARMVFDYMEKIITAPEATLLQKCFTAEASHKNDLYSWKINGGSVVSIPLSGEKIRGFRCNVLILDEFLLLSEEMVKTVLMPFLVSPRNLGKKLKEARKSGNIPKPEDLESLFTENSFKLIALSSASYTFENLYKVFCEWMSNIFSNEKPRATYFIAQLGYEAVPPEMVESGIIEEAQRGGASNASFLREYGAQFTDGSEGYFSAIKMSACTIPDGDEPHLKLRGDPEKKYILSIDSNLSNSPTADFFAMGILEIDEEKKQATLVHNYANAGGNLKDHLSYYYYLLKAFRPVLIIADSAGSREVIEGGNETEDFLNNRINIKYLDKWDSSKMDHEYQIMLSEAKRQYNIETGCICIRQVFSSGDFIRRANEHLQASIDYKKIWFGSRIRPCGPIFDRVVATDPHIKHSAFQSVGDMIDKQDELIHQVKKQCALIEIRTNPQGHQTFDIPTHLKREQSAHRARKDNYTALMLGTWGLKCYFDLMDYKPAPVHSTFAPIFLK